ncbi:MAG: radical SAM protein [Opitutaceae bacterium]
MIAFGPVPSRRLGRSLGINTIPPKNCSYSCTYCQVGRTTDMGIERRIFHQPETILTDVRRQLEKADLPVDYLTIVPDGEPTLDVNLGSTIGLLRSLNRPIAVISNASLIDRSDVRHDLAQADWVSLKVDAVDDRIWHRLNRPNQRLDLCTILSGVLDFARSFAGELVTETMLVEGVNDGMGHARDLADFLGRLRPSKAFLSIPTRPPAEPGVRSPCEDVVTAVFQVLAEAVPRVEYLIGYEGNAFASTGDPEEDLLRITAVHPLREEAVRELLQRNQAGWACVERLLERQELAAVEHAGRRYFTRKWRK